jgi:uncharacterized protein
MEDKSYKMKFIAPSWNDIFSQSVDLAKKLRKDKRGEKYDILVGVSRGGLVVTRLISDLLEVENVMIVRSEFYSDPGKRKKHPVITQGIPGDIRRKRVLLVDDVADSGQSLVTLKKYLESRRPKELKIATLYLKPWSRIVPDFYSETTDAWIVFPWEINEAVRSISKKDPYLLAKIGIPKSTLEKVKGLKQSGS